MPDPKRPYLRVTRRVTNAGQRVWFSCRTCGSHGDASGSTEATEVVVTNFEKRHSQPHTDWRTAEKGTQPAPGSETAREA